jgi:hypothetical protein
MLGFDYELRRRGFAGNSCQIVLELSTGVDPARLEKASRRTGPTASHPVLAARAWTQSEAALETNDVRHRRLCAFTPTRRDLTAKALQ